MDPKDRVLRCNRRSRKGFPFLSHCQCFFHVICPSPEQEATFSIQTEAGVDHEITTTAAQAVAREEFSIRRRTGSSGGWHHERPSKLRILTLEVNGEAVTFPSRLMSASCAVCPYVFSCLPFFPTQVREARRFFDQGLERLRCVNQVDEAGHRHLDLHQRRVYSAPRCPLSVSWPKAPPRRERKRYLVQPRSKAVASLLSHRGQIACFLR